MFTITTDYNTELEAFTTNLLSVHTRCILVKVECSIHDNMERHGEDSTAMSQQTIKDSLKRNYTKANLAPSPLSSILSVVLGSHLVTSVYNFI